MSTRNIIACWINLNLNLKFKYISNPPPFTTWLAKNTDRAKYCALPALGLIHTGNYFDAFKNWEFSFYNIICVFTLNYVLNSLRSATWQRIHRIYRLYPAGFSDITPTEFYYEVFKNWEFLFYNIICALTLNSVLNHLSFAIWQKKSSYLPIILCPVGFLDITPTEFKFDALKNWEFLLYNIICAFILNYVLNPLPFAI